jgi:hypothetical protein
VAQHPVVELAGDLLGLDRHSRHKGHLGIRVPASSGVPVVVAALAPVGVIVSIGAGQGSVAGEGGEFEVLAPVVDDVVPALVRFGGSTCRVSAISGQSVPLGLRSGHPWLAMSRVHPGLEAGGCRSVHGEGGCDEAVGEQRNEQSHRSLPKRPRRGVDQLD